MRNGVAFIAMIALLVGGLLLFSANANQSVKAYTKQVLQR